MTLTKNYFFLSKKIIFLLFLFFPLHAFSQHKIEGKIKDARSGEDLARASVYVIGTQLGVIADDNGHYSLSLPAGNYVFRVSYVGYKTLETKIRVNGSLKRDISLERNDTLQEVVISSQKRDENVKGIAMGVQKMNIEEIKLMPALMGEVDVLKAIQLLPGVHAASEGSSGFSVRGGSPDQNLIVLDNTTVYNPSHLMGFFSIFNNDVISSVELYKGDFPFRFGGRLSSLLDVHTKDNTPSGTKGNGGIGLISSRLTLEGNMGNKTSWMVGGRRSYADLFLKLSPDKDLRNTTLYFYDLNAKLTHRFSSNDKLEGNVYQGTDCFAMAIGEFKYGNTAASLTWSHVFSQKLLAKFSFNFTNYDYTLASRLEGMKRIWDSSITDYMFRADFHQPKNEWLDLNYGISSVLHHFQPGVVKIEGIDDYIVPANKSLEHAVYLSNEQKLSEKLRLRYGLRSSVFQNIGQTKHVYVSTEPGVGAVFDLTESSSLKADFTRNTQYMQLANNSASGSPLDIWFSASPKVKPQNANLYSIGYFRNFNDNQYEMSIETYYKDLKNVIDFADHADLILSKNLEDEVRTGTGRAYGVEWMFKKTTGKLTGFVNYTLSRSERTISGVNGGKTYVAPYDKTHVVNIVATYNFSKKINVSAIWAYSTGVPTTYPIGRYGIFGEYFPIYSARNDCRKPDYHRLDLSLNYTPRPDSKKRWKSEWNVSIYNAYFRKNPWSIYFYQENSAGGVPYAEMMYLFGIVPSITYNFKF